MAELQGTPCHFNNNNNINFNNSFPCLNASPSAESQSAVSMAGAAGLHPRDVTPHVSLGKHHAWGGSPSCAGRAGRWVR